MSTKTNCGLIVYKYNHSHKMLKYILVRKKYTYTFINLMLGRYHVGDNYTSIDLSQICKIEKLILMTSSIKTIYLTYFKNPHPYIDVKKHISHMIRKYEKLKLFLLNKSIFSSWWDYLSNLEVMDTTMWEIPKGKKRADESHRECAVREFEEETGYIKPTIFRWINQRTEMVRYNNCNYNTTYYYGKYNRRNMHKKIDIVEVAIARWMTINEISLLNMDKYKKKLLYNYDTYVKKTFFK